MTTNQINLDENINTKKPVQEIEYFRPQFRKRVSIIVFDFLICALVCLGVFIALRSAVNNSEKGKLYNEKLIQYKVESGLYIYNPDVKRHQDLMTFYNVSDDISYGAKELGLKKAIDHFHDYLLDKSGKETHDAVVKTYDDFRLDPNLLYENKPYFIRDKETNEIIKNEEAKIPSKAYVENVYGKFFDERSLGHFVTYVPEVLAIQKYFSNMLLFMEIPLSLVIGVTIIYYIIPLCFYRNKATLGRALMHTGLVDKNVLSVKFGRFTARFFIFLISEVLLSLFTFGVPLFVSFTLMAFSKKKQTFHDYMLGIEEIDTENSKIYYSKEEILSPKTSQYDLKNFKMK